MRHRPPPGRTGNSCFSPRSGVREDNKEASPWPDTQSLGGRPAQKGAGLGPAVRSSWSPGWPPVKREDMGRRRRRCRLSREPPGLWEAGGTLPWASGGTTALPTPACQTWAPPERPQNDFPLCEATALLVICCCSHRKLSERQTQRQRDRDRDRETEIRCLFLARTPVLVDQSPPSRPRFTLITSREALSPVSLSVRAPTY